MRNEIEAALAPLVGLPLVSVSRAVDMATFGFGMSTPDAEGDARLTPVTHYRLHVQEIWRITTADGSLVVGYGDYFYPPATSTIDRASFVARDAPRTRRDELVEAWQVHAGADHRVAVVTGSRGGDFGIGFADGCLLACFVCTVTPAADGSDEYWRLIPPRVTGAEQHVVVTAHGVER